MQLLVDLALALCAVGVLLMRVGFTLHETGMVRSKNSAGAVLRKVADLAVACLAFWVIGLAIVQPAFGSAPSPRPLVGWSSLLGTPDSMDAFYFLAVTLIATSLPGGVAGERSRFVPM